MKKRIISVCIAFALIVAMLLQVAQTANAMAPKSGSVGDNLTWELNDGKLTISGSGDMCDFYSPEPGTYSSEMERLSHTTSPWDYYKEEITSVEIMPGVTSIGQYAFYHCHNLVGISIPDGLISIGEGTFWECNSLQKIDLPDSIRTIGKRAFLGCDNLKNLYLPFGMTTISEDLFDECYGLTVTLSASISSIEGKRTGGLDSCNKILVEPENPYFSNDTFGALYNKSGTMLIRVPASLKEYTIPMGVKSIADYACARSRLINVIIPESVTNIGRNAFFDCNNLESAFIPNGVESIGLAAFCACVNLRNVSIPQSVKSIGDAAFAYCNNVDGIWVDLANKNYCNDSFGALYTIDKTELLQAPCWSQSKEYVIPSSVYRIGGEAFAFYESLVSIVIPSSVSTIDEAAFESCTNLSEVYFMGDAPDIKDASFLSVNATMYYPDDNATWSNVTMQDYGGYLTWVAANIPNFYGFKLDKDGWSFANAALSFAEDPVNNADAYFIPRERYDEVFGRAYVESQNLYSEEWHGSCAGMSTSSILCFLDMLNWDDYRNNNSNIDSRSTVNAYHFDYEYYNHDTKKGYATAGYNTQITRFIETYQLYLNAIDKSKLIDKLKGTYFATDVEKRNSLFKTEYVLDHISKDEGGTYIETKLEEFKTAYDNNVPLFIALFADSFGHAIVSRTDRKPEDEGNGWWKVYVYDPNKPYVNPSIRAELDGLESEESGYLFGCNELVDAGGDVYLELNPSLNQWRYCASVNSNSADSYVGSNSSGKILWRSYYYDAALNEEGDDEEKKNARMPDYFYTIDLRDLPLDDFANPHFDESSAWIPEANLAVTADGNTNCAIYDSTGELAAIVEDGDAFILSTVGSYDAHIGNGTSAGGKLYLPSDTYTVYYTSGAMHFFGNSNVISFSGDESAELTVDMALNSIQISALGEGNYKVKCANVLSIDDCSYVETEGSLNSGETFAISYSDGNKVEASTNSEHGKFQLFQKDTNQEEPIATKAVKATSFGGVWIVSGIVVIGATVLFALVKRKKHN